MQWADRCFDSLKRSTVKLDVLVVDNGSTDGTQLFIKEHYPRVMFQQSEDNIGFGRANNIGLQYALDEGYDFVYLLNQDAWIETDTIEKLIQISVANPEYGILSPFQMSADGYHIDPNFLSRLCKWECHTELINDLYNNSCKDVYEAEGVMAAHWFITRQCLEIVGGFSTTFPHYGEDDNYSERVRYKGFKIGVVPNLRVVHDRMLRVDDNKKKMYKVYISILLLLSRPQRKSKNSIFYIVRKTFSTVRRYKSAVPLSYLWKVLIRINSIKENRRFSMVKECAFLKISNK